MIKLTIGIPVYEMKGNGVKHLKSLLKKLEKQTVFPTEILVSDNSINNLIEKYLDEYKSKNKIRYIKNKGQKDPCSNLNNLINNSKGNYLKIVFQDDYPFSDEMIAKTIQRINESPRKRWFVCGSNNSKDDVNFFNTLIPYFNKNIYLGENTIGSPSVLTINNIDDSLYFDNRYVWLLDCIYYYSLYQKFGPPEIINDILVTNGIHSNQLTSTLTDKKKIKEVLFAIREFNNSPWKYFIQLKMYLKIHFSKFKLKLSKSLKNINIEKTH